MLCGSGPAARMGRVTHVPTRDMNLGRCFYAVPLGRGGSASIQPRGAQQAHLSGDCDALKVSTLRARPSTHVTRLLLQYHASSMRDSASWWS